MSLDIRVGLSSLEITPPLDLPMAGFAARSLPATGVHDALYVRSLVVAGDEPGDPTTALVVADLIGIAPHDALAIRRSIERELAIPASAVLFATTHTHGGPSTDERNGDSAEVRAFVANLCDRAVACTAEAMRTMVPARMVLKFGREATIGKNRRRPGGVVDPAVQTVRIEDATGDVIGIVCSYACHPVTLGPDNRLLTADYPGAVVRTLEAAYPGAIGLFVTGCAGQINTGHTAEASLSIRPNELRTFSEMTRIGRAIAGAAVQANEHATGPRGTPSAIAPAPQASTQVAAVTIEVDAPRLPVDEPDVLREQAGQWRRKADSLLDQGDSPSADHDRLMRWADWAERTAGAHHLPSIQLDVTAMRWGDIIVVGLPGEPFVEFALEIRRRTESHVVVFGYANGVPGYVPHRSAYDEGGYEVLHAHRVYAAPAAFAPEAGERLVEAAVSAIKILKRQEQQAR